MEQEKNKNGVIALLVVVIVILLTLVILFATGTINFKSDNNQESNGNSQINTNDNNSTDTIQTKLVDNLNCSSSETTFNGITVKIEQSIEDMVCFADVFTINGIDVKKDSGHAIDSYEFFDDNVIVMSHTTSGPIFTIYNVTSDSITKKYGSGDSSLEGYFAKSFSTNGNIITINAEGCGAQCGEKGIENAGTKAVFEIEYSNKNFSEPKLVSKINSNE